MKYLLSKHIMLYHDDENEHYYLYNIENNDTYHLNDISKIIVEKIEENTSVEEIIFHIHNITNHEVDLQFIREDVNQFILKIFKMGFIEENK